LLYECFYYFHIVIERKEMEKMYNIGSDDEDEEDDEDDEGQTALEAALAGDEDGVEEEWVDDEEDVFDEGHEYLEYLAQQASKTRPDDREDDEESEYDDLEEEIYFESPLDDLDPYVIFRDVFTGLQQHNPASYNELTKATTPKQQEFIMNLIQTADANVVKAAAAAAEAAAEAAKA
jgi:hypothetical protein